MYCGEIRGEKRTYQNAAPKLDCNRLDVEPLKCSDIPATARPSINNTFGLSDLHASGVERWMLVDNTS